MRTKWTLRVRPGSVIPSADDQIVVVREDGASLPEVAPEPYGLMIRRVNGYMLIPWWRVLSYERENVA